MATIKRYLDDIGKLIQKEQQTPQKQLEEIEKELKIFKDTKILDHNGNEILLKKEQELLKAKEILENKIYYTDLDAEIKENKYKKYVDKNIEKEIQNSLFEELLDYFKQYENKKKINDILNKSEVKNSIIDDYIKVYGIEYNMFLYDSYNKILNKVKKIYAEDIKQEILEEKAELEYIKQRRNRKKQRAKNLIALNVGIMGLLTLCDRPKKKW